MGPHALDDHVQRHQIVPALGDDHVRAALGGLHEGLVHGLDGAQVLIDDALETPAAIPHIAHDAAQDAHVRVRVHKDLDIHLVAELAVFIDQDALDDDDAGRLDGNGLLRAVMDGVVVDRALDALARLELLEMLDKHVRVEGIRVVVVEQGPLLIGHVVMGLVIIVVVDHRDLAPKALDQALGDGGLAAAGAAGDADDHDVAHVPLPLSLSFAYFTIIDSPKAIALSVK